MSLRRPRWPDGPLDRTTPLNLILVAACVAVGVLLYARGFTYEGSVLVYMIGTIVLGWPYYSARWTGWMTSLVMAAIVPTTIWLQNKAVEVGLWGYHADKKVLLGWLTQEGDGPFGWTRHLWLGNEMPTMEYAFYPLFCLWQVVMFSLYSHLLPDRWFEEEHKALRRSFPWIFGAITALWLSLRFIFPSPGPTDYAYWMMGCGFGITWAAWVWNKSFRAYTASPAFWIWGAFIMLFLPVWEAFHVGINRDWTWNIENTFPAAFTIRGESVPIHELFGYVTTATTFQALMFLYARALGKVVVKDEKLIPFCGMP